MTFNLNLEKIVLSVLISHSNIPPDIEQLWDNAFLKLIINLPYYVNDFFMIFTVTMVLFHWVHCTIWLILFYRCYNFKWYNPHIKEIGCISVSILNGLTNRWNYMDLRYSEVFLKILERLWLTTYSGNSSFIQLGLLLTLG